MTAPIFGATTICPKCRRKDRRGLAYAPGTLTTTVEFAQSVGWRILRRYGPGKRAACLAECPTCHGIGIVP